MRRMCVDSIRNSAACTGCGKAVARLRRRSWWHFVIQRERQQTHAFKQSLCTWANKTVPASHVVICCVHSDARKGGLSGSDGDDRPGGALQASGLGGALSRQGECKGTAAALPWQVYDGNLQKRQLRVFAQAAALHQ